MFGDTRVRVHAQGGRSCGDVRRRRDGHKLSQDVLGRLQVVLGDHQSFLDVLDGVTLRHQALDLPAQGHVPRSPSPRGGGPGGGKEVRQRSQEVPVWRSSVRVGAPGQRFGGPFWISCPRKQTCKHPQVPLLTNTCYFTSDGPTAEYEETLTETETVWIQTRCVKVLGHTGFQRIYAERAEGSRGAADVRQGPPGGRRRGRGSGTVIDVLVLVLVQVLLGNHDGLSRNIWSSGVVSDIITQNGNLFYKSPKQRLPSSEVGAASQEPVWMLHMDS